jgi:hypothetical protein
VRSCTLPELLTFGERRFAAHVIVLFKPKLVLPTLAGRVHEGFQARRSKKGQKATKKVDIKKIHVTLGCRATFNALLHHEYGVKFVPSPLSPVFSGSV